MKHKTHFLYYLFRNVHFVVLRNLFYERFASLKLMRSGKIIIALLFFSAPMKAQEQTPPDEFPVGTPIHHFLGSHPDIFNSFDTTGFNTVWQRADDTTKNLLKNYNLLANNSLTDSEYICHYTTAYYSKWEAEQNQTDPSRVGVKHKGGEIAFWDSAWCWSTIGLSAPACSLMYGPHYRQDKRYKRWLYPNQCYNEPGCVTYTPRFRMALNNHGGAGSNEDVCIIKVVFRYRLNPDTTKYDTTFIARTLKVGDFDTTGKFNDFYLNPVPSLGRYEYPPRFILPKDLPQIPGTPSSVDYIDWESYTGIQFRVDWLRDDTLCTLYIDYAEVYDNDGWNDFIEQPEETAFNITSYAERFPETTWPNLKYWSGVDEPYSIDCYTPIHVVDELIRSVQAPPLVVHFDPYWWHTLDVNGEDEMEMFYNIAKPEKIILGMYPCSPNSPEIRYEDFEWLRFNFQRTSTLDSNFWFKAQTFGYKTDNSWCVWRKPESPELTSMVMLALAHGSKGIIFEWFDSYQYYSNYCLENIYIDCLVDENGDPRPDSLYYTVKDNLIPRLKGNLGKILMNLNYTGEYINMEYQEQPPPGDNEYDFLSIQHYGMSYFWHAGFFSHKDYSDNKYFLLTNLRTNYAVESKLIVSNNTNYHNISFIDIEVGVGRVDTTINYNSSIEYFEEMPAGEGRLYRVAPVIKYGGRLIHNETISSTTTLIDKMTIENAATLTINSTYNADRNIKISGSGSIVSTTGGTIKFYEGSKLIVEGTATISGTAQNKLILDFLSPADSNGIVIKPGGSLTISNCKIKNTGTGIFSELNANYLNVQNVDFIDCETYSINIAGLSPGMALTIPPQIKNCTMQNSNWGIAITNLPGMLIQGNNITNTACGIYLSNVTDAQIIANVIQSNREEMAGIYCQSSGGVIRADSISGHTVGIHLANSSPKLGGNKITSNKYHGLYIGSGSIPYMKGEIAGVPPVVYAISGYNDIYENGGFEGEGEDNDGSEIYFVNSNAVLDRGCNSIYDDREPSPPLVNTELLMNCPENGSSIEVDARLNYWGSWVDESRFGWLRVNYIPYSETPCPEPQDGSTGELVRMTSFGDVIDTVYAVDIEMPELTETEEAYAEAEEYFLTGNLTSALQIYEGVINSTATEEEKYLAYQRKYSIGKLTGQSTEYFNQLSNTFAALASNTQDTLNNKILSQFSTLSKVGEQEYETAISEFDNIVQQNPNTEEAVYAEIDALTTALLIEESDSTLQKGRLGKYLIKSSANYHQRIDEILRKNFGSGSKETEKELLPTEYTLYQNYPNPFNPVTTIKYDLPNTSEVILIIYDILGRKIKELVNTKQQAGKYEVQFDASNLASGVYIYQLIAQEFVSSKKMILLK